MRRLAIWSLAALLLTAISVMFIGKPDHKHTIQIEPVTTTASTTASTTTTTAALPTAVAPPVPVPTPDPVQVTLPPPEPQGQVALPGGTGVVTTGVRSGAWWYALAVCETGNNPPTDEWRTGYFGLEGGQPEGGRGYDAELLEAESIYANYGDSAWGCAPVAWGAVPGG